MTTATNSLGTIGHSANWGAPAPHAFAITPHDTNELAYYARGIYIGGDGDMKVVTAYDETVTFVGLKAGGVLPVVVKQVFNTDTTATNLVGLY